MALVSEMAARLSAERAQFIINVSGVAAGATVAVLIRFLTRLANRTKLAGDDLCVSAALLPLWGIVVTAVLSMASTM